MKELSITDIGSIIALILSIFGILYTRKNIKLTKYIETITNQRIKWIDVLREDFAQILSLAYLFNDKISTYKKIETVKATNDFSKLSITEKSKIEKLQEHIGTSYIEIRTNASNPDNIKIIEIAILRLNSKDDYKLIALLEQLKQSFTDYDINRNVINEQFIVDMRNEMKILLKEEWEKVKYETIKGRKSNGREVAKDSWF